MRSVICDGCGEKVPYDYGDYGNPAGRFQLVERGSMGYERELDFCDSSCVVRWVLDQKDADVKRLLEQLAGERNKGRKS